MADFLYTEFVPGGGGCIVIPVAVLLTRDSLTFVAVHILVVAFKH